MEHNNLIERRDPVLVLVLSLVTCGLYLIYWYGKIYDELMELDGRTPTGNSFPLDFFLFIVTCGLWGIYADYRISEQLSELGARRGKKVNNSALIVVVLDVVAYFTGYLTNVVSSAIHQDILNKLVGDGPWRPGESPVTTGPVTPPSTNQGSAQAPRSSNEGDSNPYG